MTTKRNFTSQPETELYPEAWKLLWKIMDMRQNINQTKKSYFEFISFVIFEKCSKKHWIYFWYDFYFSTVGAKFRFVFYQYWLGVNFQMEFNLTSSF